MAQADAMCQGAAIIGAGGIARQHIAALKAASVESVHVCDLSSAVAEMTAERDGLAGWHTDHRAMLDQVRPSVVHVTTPPGTHHDLAMDAVEVGANVIVEKPVTDSVDQWRQLRQRAESVGVWVMEDHNYRFNRPVQRVLAMAERGDLGEVRHVEVTFCLDVFNEDMPYGDPNLPHPTVSMPGGAIADFLTHMAYLAWLFAGRHRKVDSHWAKLATHPSPVDEMRALIEGERATAALNFSSHSQPDGFWLRVYGSKATARINLFESRLTIDRIRSSQPPLTHLGNGLAEAGGVAMASLRSLWGKLGQNPGAYAGLWSLIGQAYQAAAHGTPPPISHDEVEQVHQLVSDLSAKAPAA